jgi:hypothetical protein
MKSAVMERPVVAGNVEGRALECTDPQRGVPIGVSTFSGNMLYVPQRYVDKKTGTILLKLRGRMLTPTGPYIGVDGKLAEDEQRYISAQED